MWIFWFIKKKKCSSHIFEVFSMVAILFIQDSGKMDKQFSLHPFGCKLDCKRLNIDMALRKKKSFLMIILFHFPSQLWKRMSQRTFAISTTLLAAGRGSPPNSSSSTGSGRTCPRVQHRLFTRSQLVDTGDASKLAVLCYCAHTPCCF